MKKGTAENRAIRSKASGGPRSVAGRYTAIARNRFDGLMLGHAAFRNAARFLTTVRSPGYQFLQKPEEELLSGDTYHVALATVIFAPSGNVA